LSERILDLLSKQGDEAISSQDMLIAVHALLGNTPQQTSEQMDISLFKVTKALNLLHSEGLLDVAPVAVAPIQRPTRLSATIDSALKATAPKKKRRAVKTKPRAKVSNTHQSPLEVAPTDWAPTHVLKYFEIRWCEQGWKTPPPRWQAKDRMNAKRFFEEYSGDSRKIIDYLFDHWTALQGRFNIQGLPSMGIMWGFRSSIVPLALGDVSTAQTKQWGSTHDSSANRDDGDEVGW